MASRSGGRADTSGSTARPSAIEPPSPSDDAALRARAAARSRGSGRGGGIAARISCCSMRAGSSTASAPSGCGARKASGCRASAASANGSATRRSRPIGCGRERPDHVWALDFQFDQTADGHNLKLLHVVDEFTREALAIECHRRIDADDTVDVLDRLVGERGTAPAFIRCDNGPEMTANALRDWCRFCRAGSAYIEPGLAVAEPVRRELRRPRPRRAARRRAVLLPGRSPGADRGLAPGLQPAPAPLSARDDDPRRVRRQSPSASAAAHSNCGWGRGRARIPASQRWRRPTAGSSSQPGNGRVLLRRSPHRSYTDRHSSYRGSTTTSTQLSQQVDR